MARTVSTQENHARYERALARSSGKRQVKGISPTRPQKTQEFALRHQAHASPEQLTQTVLDAVSMYSQLKKLQLDGRNTKKLLRKIMARNAKDLAFSQFYKVCEDFHDWEKAIDFLNSRPEDVELNVRLAFIARQIINQTIPTPTPTPTLRRTKKQSPLQFEDDTVHPLYECAECEHPFRSEVPIDENHCPACRCITHDAQLVVESEELTEVQTYVDGSVKYAKIAGYASGFTAENIEECQQTLDQIDQLIHASPDKMYFIWDNDQDGDGALQYILRQLTSTYSNEYIGFFRIKRDIDPDNLIMGMEHFEVINVVNTTEELSGAPPGDWSFHGKVGIDKMVLHATHQYPEQRKLAIFFVGGATTVFGTSQDGQPEGEALYCERTYPDVPIFINEDVSRDGQTSADFGWPAARGSVFQ